MAKDDKVYIRFREERTTKEAQPQIFAAGRIYAMSRQSADHWLTRLAAEPSTAEAFKEQIRADKAPKPSPKTSESTETDSGLPLTQNETPKAPEGTVLNPPPAGSVLNPPAGGGGGSQSNPAGKP